MSLFATIAIVCTMSKCDDYKVDQSRSVADARANTLRVNKELDEAMQDEHTMDGFLLKYKINESVFEIISIDIETRPIIN